MRHEQPATSVVSSSANATKQVAVAYQAGPTTSGTGDSLARSVRRPEAPPSPPPDPLFSRLVI